MHYLIYSFWFRAEFLYTNQPYIVIMLSIFYNFSLNIRYFPFRNSDFCSTQECDDVTTPHYPIYALGILENWSLMRGGRIRRFDYIIVCQLEMRIFSHFSWGGSLRRLIVHLYFSTTSFLDLPCISHNLLSWKKRFPFHFLLGNIGIRYQYKGIMVKRNYYTKTMEHGRIKQWRCNFMVWIALMNFSSDMKLLSNRSYFLVFLQNSNT